MTDAERFPWMRAPAAIAGRWRVSPSGCQTIGGMVVEIKIPADSPRTATGRVVTPGDGAKLGYRSGEEVMRLEANDHGNWPGKVKWRSILGVQRWDPVYFVLRDRGELDGTMAPDSCWRSMTWTR